MTIIQGKKLKTQGRKTQNSSKKLKVSAKSKTRFAENRSKKKGCTKVICPQKKECPSGSLACFYSLAFVISGLWWLICSPSTTVIDQANVTLLWAARDFYYLHPNDVNQYIPSLYRTIMYLRNKPCGGTHFVRQLRIRN